MVVKDWFYENYASLLIEFDLISNEFVSNVTIDEESRFQETLSCVVAQLFLCFIVAQLLSWIGMDELMEQVLPRVYCT